MIISGLNSFSSGAPTVGPVQGLTIPNLSGLGPIRPNVSRPAAAPAAAPSAPSAYDGPLANKSFLGEPFAVWLGLVLFLAVLKYAAESPRVKLLGENVNPAFIRIGGYNVMVIGVVASVWIVLSRVIFNHVRIPGITDYVNAQ